MTKNAYNHLRRQRSGGTANYEIKGINRSLIYVKNEYRDIGVCAILADDYVKPNGSTYKIAKPTNIFDTIFR
jgi:hypothetical protein